LFFPPELLGEIKQKKRTKVAIFTEFVLGDHQKKKKAKIYEISIFPSRL
jgi:hypothetical protein